MVFVVPVLQCKTPEVAISNQTELTFSCPDEHVHGARCTLACTQGYSLLGEKAVVCERDNNTHPPTMHWEGAVGALGHPKCIGRSTPLLALHAPGDIIRETENKGLSLVLFFICEFRLQMGHAPSRLSLTIGWK